MRIFNYSHYTRTDIHARIYKEDIYVYVFVYIFNYLLLVLLPLPLLAILKIAKKPF